MKIIKLLLNAILIVSFLCGCSKNIDKKEDAPTKTEENKKEDNKVNRQENNPNDKNNINNNEVISYSNFRKVENLVFPFTIEQNTPKKDGDYIIRVSKMENNKITDDNIFKFR